LTIRFAGLWEENALGFEPHPSKGDNTGTFVSSREASNESAWKAMDEGGVVITYVITKPFIQT
jgi:hypothetical protein